MDKKDERISLSSLRSIDRSIEGEENQLCEGNTRMMERIEIETNERFPRLSLLYIYTSPRDWLLEDPEGNQPERGGQRERRGVTSWWHAVSRRGLCPLRDKLGRDYRWICIPVIDSKNQEFDSIISIAQCIGWCQWLTKMLESDDPWIHCGCRTRC